MPACYRHPDRETYIRCQRCERPICPDCMVDAAVGFQCPECIAEGAKSTRSGRSAYGGTRSGSPQATSQALIAVNVVVWLAILLTGGSASRLVDILALRPNGLCFFPGAGGFEMTTAQCATERGLYLPGVVDGAWWQLFTNSFAHVEIWHVGFNMLALWVLGPQLELAVGRARFVAIYLGSALAGSALVYVASSEYGATLGASGAIFGLLGALLVLAVKIRGNVQGILVWVGINAAITVLGRSFISWQGHLGGFLGGLLLTLAIVYAPRRQRTFWQSLGVGAVLALTLLAMGARTLQLG